MPSTTHTQSSSINAGLKTNNPSTVYNFPIKTYAPHTLTTRLLGKIVVTKIVSTPCKGWISITSNAFTLGYGHECTTNKHSIHSGPWEGLEFFFFFFFLGSSFCMHFFFSFDNGHSWRWCCSFGGLESKIYTIFWDRWMDNWNSQKIRVLYDVKIIKVLTVS